MSEARDEVVRSKVIIIGAGPAGLAAGGALRTRGVPFEIVEKSGEVGTSWRNHYKRLHLHTVKQHSSLPWMPFPEHYPTYPSRQQIVDYLNEYARRFNLQPHFGHTVTHAGREGGIWRVQTDQGRTFEGEHLVVATGYNAQPKIPDWPGLDDFGGKFMHSRHFDDGQNYRGARALVVGFGNSAGEIALDLFEFGATVTMAVRSPVHVVPRDAFGKLPAQLNSLTLARLPVAVADAIGNRLSRLLVGDLTRYGLRRPATGPVRQVVEQGKVPLIDIGTIDLIKQGAIDVVPAGIETFTESGVVFENGNEREFELVVAATGYKPRLDRFLENADALTDERGYPLRHGATSPDSEPFFIGFRNPITGALKDIADEARAIAGRISTERQAAAV